MWTKWKGSWGVPTPKGFTPAQNGVVWNFSGGEKLFFFSRKICHLKLTLARHKPKLKPVSSAHRIILGPFNFFWIFFFFFFSGEAERERRVKFLRTVRAKIIVINNFAFVMWSYQVHRIIDVDDTRWIELDQFNTTTLMRFNSNLTKCISIWTRRIWHENFKPNPSGVWWMLLLLCLFT